MQPATDHQTKAAIERAAKIGGELRDAIQCVATEPITPDDGPTMELLAETWAVASAEFDGLPADVTETARSAFTAGFFAD